MSGTSDEGVDTADPQYAVQCGAFEPRIVKINSLNAIPIHDDVVMRDVDQINTPPPPVTTESNGMLKIVRATLNEARSESAAEAVKSIESQGSTETQSPALIPKVTKQLGDKTFVIVVPPCTGDQLNSTIQFKTSASGEPIIVKTTECISSSNMSVPERVIQDASESGLDSQSKPIPQSAVCVVCGDKGSGYHYSTFSCEGCKGFFKRTVQKNLNYACKDQGACVINKYTRNNCQYCRFRLCLQMGMKREAVREDRSPGGKHRKRAKFEEYDSQMISDEYTDSTIELLKAAQPDMIPKHEGQPDMSNIGINEMMQYGYTELKYIIDWARKVPGFQTLKLEDQMALLKSSFMELNVLRLAYRSKELDGSIMFAANLILTSDFAQKIGWGHELVNATLDFSSRLKEFDLDNTEFCIMNGIVLTYPDAAGIQNKQTVTALQSKFIDCLRRYVSHNYPADRRRFGKMLLRLPALRTVSAKAAERFLSLTLDGCIQLNDLVSELIS